MLENLRLDERPLETLVPKHQSFGELLDYAEDREPEPEESGSGVIPPDCPTGTTIETDSGILATGQQSPMPVEPISGGVNLASSPCLSLEAMDMVNDKPEREPPSVPEDVALTPSAVQLLPRGYNQTHQMPTVVRIPPQCDRHHTQWS